MDGWKFEKEYFPPSRNYLKIKFSFHTIFKNTTIPNYFYTVYGYFCVFTTPEFSSCKSLHSPQSLYRLAFYTKRFLTLIQSIIIIIINIMIIIINNTITLSNSFYFTCILSCFLNNPMQQAGKILNDHLSYFKNK